MSFRSNPKRSLFIGLLVAGAMLRLAALPLPGTGDVTIWKAWIYHVYQDGPAGVYGAPTARAADERFALPWYGVNQPPAMAYELAAAGWLYTRLDPSFSHA